MAGKRVLDAVALLNASRVVASKHFSIRRSQVELYARTSSLTKGLNRRTAQIRSDPSTPAQPFSNSAPAGAERPSRPIEAATSTASVEGQVEAGSADQGLAQDHHYARSEDNSAADPVPGHDLDVQQEEARRHPLADGTIPPQHSEVGQVAPDRDTCNQRPRGNTAKTPLSRDTPQEEDTLQVAASGHSTILDPSADLHNLSAEGAKVLQRNSESQIPSNSAEPPGAEAFSPDKIIGETSEYQVEQEQDVYYQPPDSTSRVLSSLPRVKLPRSTEDIQGGDPHLPQGMNADVYYSSKTRSEEDPRNQAEAVEGIPSDEALSGLFHSPRTARLLGLKSKQMPNGLKPRGSRTMTTSHPQFLQGNGAKPFEETKSDIGSSSKSDQESIEKLAADMAKDGEAPESFPSQIASSNRKLPYEMRESSVPSSQIGRLWQFGGLAASMAFGAVGDRLNGSSNASAEQGSSFLSADSKMLPKPIHDVLQRVQDSADYMPAAQRNAVLAVDLGNDWRELFESFDEKPIAAASIGQVHGAVLKSSGHRVAVKVQYPGVASSISSDLNNLSLLLTASRLLPKGLYLDKTIANARTELAWECDYIREAECAKRFRDLLADEIDTFTVPRIIDEASGKRVLTMERMEGIAVTKVRNLNQEQKDWIGTQILRLCLREIIEFNFMQTDPNWTNFLYNDKTSKLELLDFGASREFPQKFINLYIQVLAAASRSDRDACRDLSVQLGYLTGYESKAMLNAHIDSVMTLAEPFMSTAPDVYDFQNQTITDRVRGLIPVMIRERLAPPPEETYSMHRKLSGAFLLCARLGSRVKCKEMFKQALAKSGLA